MHLQTTWNCSLPADALRLGAAGYDLQRLMEHMDPPAVDLEIRQLSSAGDICALLAFLCSGLRRRRSYELFQAYTHLTMTVHSALLVELAPQHPEVLEGMIALREVSWRE